LQDTDEVDCAPRRFRVRKRSQVGVPLLQR